VAQDFFTWWEVWNFLRVVQMVSCVTAEGREEHFHFGKEERVMTARLFVTSVM
jgi:hypothetical protein